MANFLFVDTSSAIGVASVFTETSGIISKYISDQGKQAAEINVVIEAAVQEAGITLNQIDAFCVCAGPGSYTGLRVGMSTLKGMAFSLNKPLMSFDKLQLIVLSFPRIDNPAGVLLKARKEEYFWGLYDQDGKVLEKPVHIFENRLMEHLRAGIILITDTEIDIPGAERKVYPADFKIDPNKWLLLAQERFEKKEFSDLAYAEPFYLKSAFTTVPKPKI